jgi:N-acetylglucosamine-6-phosphate deacetylase
MSTVFHSGRIVTPSSVIHDGFIETSNGRIVRVGPGAPGKSARSDDHVRKLVDLRGAVVVPGFIDIHTHGGGGASFSDGSSAIGRAVRMHLGHGTTTMLVSLITDSQSKMEAEAASAAAVHGTARDVIAGIHLEGPFVSGCHLGIMPGRHARQPSLAAVDAIQRASGGLVRMVTIAPELDSAMSLISELKTKGIIPAIGHSAADYDQAMQAARAGATVVTHLFNAMRPIHHRSPGIVAAAMDANLYVEVINDGTHLHDATIRMVHRLFPQKIISITDAMPATGAPDGTYEIAGQRALVQDGKSRLLNDDGTLGPVAGSTLTMDVAFKRAVEVGGFTLDEAVASTSTNAARLLGIHREVGAITAGLWAHLVFLDPELRVRAVLRGDRWADERRP